MQVYSDRFDELAVVWQARDLAVGVIDEDEPDASLEKSRQRIASFSLKYTRAERRGQKQGESLAPPNGSLAHSSLGRFIFYRTKCWHLKQSKLSLAS